MSAAVKVPVGRLAQRVAKGVALLDREQPGWHERVYVDELRMYDPFWCVLGQVFGDFYDGAEDLFSDAYDPDPTASHGFQLGQLDAERDYAFLSRLWSYVIKARQRP